MGLNIKNPRTVALVRELAERTGESQTCAIETAVAERLARLNAHEHSPEVARRIAAMQEVLDEIHANLTDEDREALRHGEADLYDEWGLPR